MAQSESTVFHSLPLVRRRLHPYRSCIALRSSTDLQMEHARWSRWCRETSSVLFWCFPPSPRWPAESMFDVVRNSMSESARPNSACETFEGSFSSAPRLASLISFVDPVDSVGFGTSSSSCANPHYKLVGSVRATTADSPVSS